MWLNIEQLYNSLMRSIFSKINANIVTPGPLSIYRKSALEKLKGFSEKGFSEDVDIAVRLIRNGYRIGFNENAVAMTNMPYTARGFLKQRSRFARGWVDIFKKHLQLNSTIIDIYSLPLALFTYVQGVIFGAITLYTIITGYLIYFVAQGIYINFVVLRYFTEWLSVIGTIRWIIDILHGNTPLTFIGFISLITFLLSYPLYIVSIIRFDRKLSIRHIFPLMFMPPFWLVIMTIYIVNLPECFRKHQQNVWEKIN